MAFTLTEVVAEPNHPDLEDLTHATPRIKRIVAESFGAGPAVDAGRQQHARVGVPRLAVGPRAANKCLCVGPESVRPQRLRPAFPNNR